MYQAHFGETCERAQLTRRTIVSTFTFKTEKIKCPFILYHPHLLFLLVILYGTPHTCPNESYVMMIALIPISCP